MIIIGIMFIIIFWISIMIWVNKDGLLCLFNFGRIGFTIWCLGIGLYNLSLTQIYKPHIIINIVSIVIIFNFWLISHMFAIETKKLVDIFSCEEKNGSGYKLAVLFTLILAVWSFIVNYRAGNLRYFTGQSTRESFALGYFLHLSTVVSLYFWIKGRTSDGLISGMKYFALSAICLFMIMTDLSRSPLILFVVGVALFEISRYVKKKKNLSRKKVIWFAIIALVVVFVFGYIGEVRTEVIFHGQMLSFYKMKIKMPEAYAWVYLYLTSPFENTNHLLINSYDIPLSWGNRLLYPVIKLISNFVGVGGVYRKYFNSLPTAPIFLDKDYGLNASTFISAAILDFGVIGVFVYLAFFDLIAYMWMRLMKSKKIAKNSKLIISSLLFQIPLLSSFTNSIFGIAFIWVNVFFVLFWNWTDRFFKIKDISIPHI